MEQGCENKRGYAREDIFDFNVYDLTVNELDVNDPLDFYINALGASSAVGITDRQMLIRERSTLRL